MLFKNFRIDPIQLIRQQVEVTVLERSQALVGNLELKRAHKWRWVVQYADVCDIDRTHFSSKSRKQNLKTTQKNPSFQ